MGPGVESREAERREVRALLRLQRIQGLGDRGVRKLVARHGSATSALRSLGDQVDLLDGEPGGPELPGDGNRDDAMPLTSSRYPTRLLELEDPPPVLFLRGRPDLLTRPSVAIVGARRATETGRRMAGSLAQLLAGAGVVVVSGMALGIDGAAHQGALAVGGDSLGVLGCGLDVVYPGTHRRLFREMSRSGLLLSEFPPSAPALPHHFPRRNRIIAALARAVVVVEAGDRSGALITADHALDLGRAVLAVPGSVANPQARGCNLLLRDGATVLPYPEAILEELAGLVAEAGRGRGGTGPSPHLPLEAVPPVPLELRPLWGALAGEPRGLDRIAELAGLSHGEALAGLAALELGGWVAPCPGMRFRRA